jgi:hypothetical protein
MEGGAADGVVSVYLCLEVEAGLDEVDGGDGGREHQDGLSGVGEGRVDDGLDLLDEGDGVLGVALGHLHALQPDLNGAGGTWCSWSFVGRITVMIIMQLPYRSTDLLTLMYPAELKVKGEPTSLKAAGKGTSVMLFLIVFACGNELPADLKDT